LGAAMDSSACHTREKYCHNGGIAFGPSQPPSGPDRGSTDRVVGGVMIEVMAPMAAPLKTVDLQE
jgi:hypothetical protein